MVHQRNRASDGRCLYYYGSLATLSSMLSTRQIWLSDIRKSNDSDEIAYGVRQIKHRLDAVLSSLSDGRRQLVIPSDFLKDNGFAAPLTQDEFQTLGGELSTALREIYSHMDAKRDSLYAHFGKRRCFALCFTGNGDVLSQWRGYGDNARGVAVGFDKASVLQYVRANTDTAIPGVKLLFRPVYYRENDNALHSYVKSDLRQAPFLSRRFEVTRGHLFREDEMGRLTGFYTICCHSLAKEACAARTAP